MELRQGLGSRSLFDARQRQDLTAGVILGREKQPEVELAELDRLGIEPGVLVLGEERIDPVTDRFIGALLADVGPGFLEPCG